jgi:HEAT repeat protein
LREITGLNPGDRPEDWQALLSRDDQGKDLLPEVQGTRLGDELVTTPPGGKTVLPAKVQEEQGQDKLSTLTGDLIHLQGSAREQARQALVDRLRRVPTADLRNLLQDDQAEVRRAAALVCAAREDQVLIPVLIPLLEDPDSEVADAAHEALKKLAGQDFGPAPGASLTERQSAVADWNAWWKKQAGQPLSPEK